MNSILEIKQYAKENNVPIITDEGIAFLLEQIKQYKVKEVLEIGTAIAYSSSLMALAGVSVTTIERDLNMYNQARININDLGLNDKIKVIFKDALEAYSLVEDKKYDLIFIDAAKAQYEKFFNMYTPLLNEGGIVVCDNLDFHGLVKEKDLTSYSRNLRSMIKKIRLFRSFLENNENYTTKIYNIGDGMSVSIKKKFN